MLKNRPEKICLNCEYFDHWPKSSAMGDCRNSRSPRFTPKINFTCNEFYLSTTYEELQMSHFDEIKQWVILKELDHIVDRKPINLEEFFRELKEQIRQSEAKITVDKSTEHAE